jgi:hypothetical protein
MLFTHIIRAFGITIALMINAIIFLPFFVFGILPVLVKKSFGKISTSVYPPLAPTNLNGIVERSRGKFLSHGKYRTESPNGDVSPLLLSADSSVSDFAPYGDRAIIFCNFRDDFQRLSGPGFDLPSVLGGYATYDGPTTQVTQPRVPRSDCTGTGNSQDCTKPDNAIEDTSEDEGLLMKGTHSVDSLNGTRSRRGLASGLKVPSHDQGVGGNTVMKREKTWETLQDAVYPTSKLL